MCPKSKSVVTVGSWKKELWKWNRECSSTCDTTNRDSSSWGGRNSQVHKFLTYHHLFVPGRDSDADVNVAWKHLSNAPPWTITSTVVMYIFSMIFFFDYRLCSTADRLLICGVSYSESEWNLGDWSEETCLQHTKCCPGAFYSVLFLSCWSQAMRFDLHHNLGSFHPKFKPIYLYIQQSSYHL
jgi:hypothetical protein